MCPEFDLEVAHLFDGSLHFAKKALKFNDIRKLWVYMLMFKVILLNKFLNDTLVAEDSELLLETWLFLLCYIQLNQRCMNVPHHFELIERESNVNARAIHKLN